MTRRPTTPPAPESDEHGIDADLIRRDERQEARKALYVGARSDLVDRLRQGQSPSTVEMVTPSVAAARLRRGRAAVYCRVSTEEQARMGGGDEGYLIPYQRDICERYAREHDLEIADFYIDPGKTGTTINRREFKRMFAELRERGITHIIVHKLDRLSRSPKVDYFVDEQREPTKTTLVSVTEYIDETPQGLLNLQFMRGVAAYYSNNLAAEVEKGIQTKLRQGGTPGQAPLGYLNKQRKEGRADIRWVEVDPDRAHHIRWAFEAYAGGNWTVKSLAEALEARGLRNRGSAARPPRPLTTSGVYKLLTNPYFVGIVVYRGGYHDGAHPSLVSRDLWLQVQDVLAAHNTAGEKDRRHPHYLKGSIYCGACGNRLVFSRNIGRSGNAYDYFFCLGKRAKAAKCDRKFIRVAAVEQGVEQFYEGLVLTPERVDAIRDVVTRELSHQQTDAAATLRDATRRVREVKDEQAKLLTAHYAGAVPLDLLKAEMDRTSRELVAAEKLQNDASMTLEDVETQLDRALAVVEACPQEYATAVPSERRLFNQGFFTKLFIAQDGTVEDAEVQDLFAGLLLRDAQTATLSRAEDAADVPTQLDAVRQARDAQRESVAVVRKLAATGTDGALVNIAEWGTRPERRWSPTAVLLSLGDVSAAGHAKTPLKLSFGRGVNKAILAEDAGFEPARGFIPNTLSKRAP